MSEQPADGSVSFTCYSKKPAVDLPLYIKAFREEHMYGKYIIWSNKVCTGGGGQPYTGRIFVDLA